VEETIGPQPPRFPTIAYCAAPDSAATTRQGIKTGRSPAGKVGERGRRRAPVNAAFDRGCRRRRPRGSFAPIARAPSSPRTAISLKRKSATSVSSRSAGPSSSSSSAPRRILGHHPPRDKEHQLATRKCRRESTPQTVRQFQSAEKKRGENIDFLVHDDQLPHGEWGCKQTPLLCKRAKTEYSSERSNGAAILQRVSSPTHPDKRDRP
jgi:hypothetical protein